MIVKVLGERPFFVSLSASSNWIVATRVPALIDRKRGGFVATPFYYTQLDFWAKNLRVEKMTSFPPAVAHSKKGRHHYQDFFLPLRFDGIYPVLDRGCP